MFRVYKKNPFIDAAFSEVYRKTPKGVIKSGKTGAAKRKMMVAIALSKARRAQRLTGGH